MSELRFSLTRPRLVSVIIVVYDQATTLRWLLASLAAQDYRAPFEILICDDGSSDETMDVVQQADRDHRLDLRYLWQPDRGFRASRSRNNGIRAAQGDLLIGIDGDQVVDTDFLSRHVASHRRSRQLVVGPIKRLPLDPPITTSDEALRLGRESRGAELFPERQAEWAGGPYPWMSFLSGNFSCARRPEVLFDEGFVGWGGEDRELALRLTGRYDYRLVFDACNPSFHLFGDAGTPFKTHDKIVQFLRNRLYFHSLHPDEDIQPLLETMRFCRLDPNTDRWSVGAPDGRGLDEVLGQARDWIHSHGVQ